MAQIETRIENLEEMMAAIIQKVDPKLKPKLSTYLSAVKNPNTQDHALIAKRKDIVHKLK